MRKECEQEMGSRGRCGWLVPLGLAMVFSIAGCQDNWRNTTTGAASNVPASPAANVTSPSLVGTWLSPSCGERTYARLLTFEPDGRFTAEDRVAPCPAGAQCVWSGVVYRSGTFSIEGETVHLQTEQPSRNGPGVPLPEQFTLADGLVERGAGDAGPVDCAYLKQSR